MDLNGLFSHFKFDFPVIFHDSWVGIILLLT